MTDFLCSKTGKALYDEKTKLWCNGPAYITELYKEELEKKGVEIIGNDVKIYRGKDCAKAAGHLQVSMPIGESRPSELKEVPRIEEKQQGETIHGDDGGSH